MEMPHLSPGWTFSSSLFSRELEFTFSSRGAREEGGEPQVKAAELGKEQVQATTSQCLWEAALQNKSLRSFVLVSRRQERGTCNTLLRRHPQGTNFTVCYLQA